MVWTVTGGINLVASLACALWVWWLYVQVLMHWLGPIGFGVGILTTPGFVLFPALFWLVEGVPPVGYWVLWLVGTFGFYLALYQLQRGAAGSSSLE